jgi:hypothetical protein
MRRFAPERLDDADRTEYEYLYRRVTSGRSPASSALRALAWITAIVLLVIAAIEFWNRPTSPTIVGLIVAAVAVLGVGLAASVLLERADRTAGERRQAELEQKAKRSPYFPPSDPSWDTSSRDDRGVDWARYPVTGAYDPDLYRARGGRSTAHGMKIWGIDDYESYRSNIE